MMTKRAPSEAWRRAWFSATPRFTVSRRWSAPWRARSGRDATVCQEFQAWAGSRRTAVSGLASSLPAQWNSKAPLFKRGKAHKLFRIARKDWWLEFFADSENVVPPGDVEIHSELNDVPQPGYRGVKTTLIDRETSITSARVALDRTATRRGVDKIYAEIRYEDDSGPQSYFVTQNEITIGRGGEDLSVDLPLYTNDEVSREHLRLRRDPATGSFTVADNSRNGTWLNGRKLRHGVEEALPDRARIQVAEVITLSFEVKR